MKIHTEITNKEIEQALNGTLINLWNVIGSLEGDEEFEKELEKIKYGYKTKFDIRSIVEEEYEKKLAFGTITLERKQNIDITEFRDEIDHRKKKIKEILRGLYDDTFDNQKEEEIHGY